MAAEAQLSPDVLSIPQQKASQAIASPVGDLLATLETMGRVLSFQDTPPPPPPPKYPRAFSPVMQTMAYHEQFMDETPEGRALRDNWRRQVVLETRAVEAAAARYRRDLAAAVQRGEGANLPASRRLLLRWYAPLVDAIKEEQRKIYMREVQVDRTVYGPFLLLLEPQQLAVIAMHCTLHAIMELGGTNPEIVVPGQTRVTRLAVTIGRMIENQVNLEKVQSICRKHAKANREVAALYAEGEDLRAKLTQGGRLEPEEWSRWRQLGAMLEELGEVQPLDHLDWFVPGEKLGQRLERLPAMWSGGGPIGQGTRRLMSAVKKALDPEDLEAWRGETHAKVGAALINLILGTCTVDLPGRGPGGEPRAVPAFWHRLELAADGSASAASRGAGSLKRYGVLCAHEEVLKRVQPSHMVEAFIPQYVPMLIKPVPWQRHDRGGHVTLRNNVMRLRGSHLQSEMLARADQDMVNGRGPGLSKVYEALNALGETPWQTNVPVHRVAEALWGLGGGVCDVPRRMNYTVPPPLPAGFRLHRSEGPGSGFAVFDYGRDAARSSRVAARQLRRRNSELHALRCDMEYKLAVAREFAGEPRFYYPHNVDFRGRAYPMHPHLNHLGSDLCRGLLRFADRRPLGERGLRWLYVQAANLWGAGVDKLPFAERAAWAEAHLGDLVRNARDPMDTGAGTLDDSLARADAAALARLVERAADREDDRAFWVKAEEPFQFLATCMEIADAHASGDPASFPSRLPTHMDGSCNGLQHYAALGRDAAGGQAVNLRPAARPQDVYSQIAALVRARVDRDAAAGVTHARALRDATPIDRKLVKQTVMTSVYGVTFVGARGQITSRLKERGFQDSRLMYKVSCYSAKVTLECLMEMFSCAKDIMNWLAECAKLVAGTGATVQWTTPLGLPVVQPYRRTTRHHVRTLLQRLVVVENNDELPVMKTRQRTAFPPNFIHSVDSSHMMMTAIACRRAGMSFAGVHDSFWTHAGDIEQMNSILRDAFVELHSQPLLENLLADFRASFPEVEFPELPKRGDLDLEEVRKAEYFFS
ncbi:hypothetical protein ACKKBG_A37250 [Auxenochlorella protothecoides x Auxenochlorella symbiontica]